MRLRQQSAVEFITTYSWAMLIIALFIAIVTVLALSRAPSSYLASSCSIQPSLPCTGTVFAYNDIKPPKFYLMFINNLGVTMYFPYNGFNLTTTNVGSPGTSYSIGNCTPLLSTVGTPVTCVASVGGTYSFLKRYLGAQTTTPFTFNYLLCSSNTQASCSNTVYKSSGLSVQSITPSNTALFPVTFQINPSVGSIALNGALYVNNVVAYFPGRGYNLYAVPPAGYMFSSWSIASPSSTLSSTTTQNTVLTLNSNAVVVLTVSAVAVTSTVTFVTTTV